ncbi:Uncharacterized conserved protein YbjT, contains NAD(P)-binding and DUF2867 domains [Rhizobiales bacterium GAS188]|nr:Uncharacterized conserved protein YbjT, contains NAD(P)-binding and DUF2867 domains [Rhizobiales bacterium GAS188]
MHRAECYVVTGVSGRTGAAVARTLIEAGERVRVVVRDAAKGNVWARQGAQVAVADLTDVRALSDALSGARGAYLLSPQHYALDDLFARAETVAGAIAEAAVTARLPKLVALSSVGADRPDGTGWIGMNRMLEQRLGRIGLPVTFLRAGYFMENWAPMAGVAVTQGVLHSFLAPLDRAVPMVATADVGRVAAEALCEDWIGTRTITLEGPTSYSPNNVAEAFAQELGRPMLANAVPESSWAEALSHGGFSPAATAGFIEMTRALNSGHISFASDTGVDHRKGRVPLDTVVAAMAKA